MKKGEEMSEEQKRKISKSLIGHEVSLATRKKIGKKCKGIVPLRTFTNGDKPPKHKPDCECFRCNPIRKKHCFSRDNKTQYSNLHHWVANKLGKPKNCTLCGNKKLKLFHYHWANISGEYKKDETDWIRLCYKCHREYDKKLTKKNA